MNKTQPQQAYKVWHLLLAVFVMAFTIRLGLGSLPLPDQTQAIQASYYHAPSSYNRVVMLRDNLDTADPNTSTFGHGETEQPVPATVALPTR